MSWVQVLSAWAALAAFLAALGAFIDRYHLRGHRLERLRHGLVRLWIALEAARPELPWRRSEKQLSEFDDLLHSLRLALVGGIGLIAGIYLVGPEQRPQPA